jgi:hypothetical protein
VIVGDLVVVMAPLGPQLQWQVTTLEEKTTQRCRYWQDQSTTNDIGLTK